MGMKIECLVCLKETTIPKNLNTEKYDGQITCRECGSLLQVKLVKSKVEQCKVVMDGKTRLSPPQALEEREAGPEGKALLSGREVLTVAGCCCAEHDDSGRNLLACERRASTHLPTSNSTLVPSTTTLTKNP